MGGDNNAVHENRIVGKRLRASVYDAHDPPSESAASILPSDGGLMSALARTVCAPGVDQPDRPPSSNASAAGEPRPHVKAASSADPPLLTVRVLRSQSMANDCRVAWVDVFGELDAFSAPVLLERLHAELAAGARLLIVDASGIEFCSILGVDVLAAARDRALALDGELYLAHCSRPVLKVLRRLLTIGSDWNLPLRNR